LAVSIGWYLKVVRARYYSSQSAKDSGEISFQQDKGKKQVVKLRFLISGGGRYPKMLVSFSEIWASKCWKALPYRNIAGNGCYGKRAYCYGTVGRIIPRIEVGIQNIDTKQIYAVQTHETFKPDFESEKARSLFVATV